MSECDDKLQALRDEIFGVDTSHAEVLWREYVITYLQCFYDVENFGLEEVAEGTPEALGSVAEEVLGSLGFEHPSIRLEDTENQLRSLILNVANECLESAQHNVASGADPVTLFNGQFVYQVEDFKIDGAGMDFAFTRTYKNQVNLNGPLGFGWLHSLYTWLRVANEVIFRSTGDLREEAFSRHPRFGESNDFSYWMPPDGVHAVIFENGESFDLRMPDGLRHRFSKHPTHDFLHRLDRVEDRHGNYLQLRYRDEQLGEVEVNHPTRVVRFAYDDQGRICVVGDHTGRQWVYSYDSFGDLVAVTSPRTDRYPAGLTVAYEYSSASQSGALQHNLTLIVDASGRAYLENEFGTAPGLLDFNRVVRQRQGGGETFFEYEDVVEEFEFDYPKEQRPAHQTIVTERNGQVVRHVFNAFGNLLRTDRAIIGCGLLRTLVEHHRYNRDGSMVATLSPEGVLRLDLHGRDFFLRTHGSVDGEVPTDPLTWRERQQFGRVLATVTRADYVDHASVFRSRGEWGDIADIFDRTHDPDHRDVIVKLTYEDEYGQLRTASDPRFTIDPDPKAAVEHPRHQETLTEYVYDGPSGEPRFLVEIRRPASTFPDGTRGTPVIEEFRMTDGTPGYDEHGRLRRYINAVSTVTEHTYVPASPTDPREGYLERTVVDPNGVAITTEFEVDALGRVIATHFPRSAGMTDGRFVKRVTYNELNQVVEEVSSKPFEFRTRRFYDENGKLQRQERDATDRSGSTMPDGPEVRTYEYDDEFNPTREATGGADPAHHLVTRHDYDAAGQRILTVQPRGNRTRYRYDERGLVTAKTVGDCTEDASTTRVEYDGDGRLVRKRDARGHAVVLVLDALGRIVEEENAIGSIVRRAYNKLDLLTNERVFERRSDGYYLLSRHTTEYDELGRAIRTLTDRFMQPPGPVSREQVASGFLTGPVPGATPLETRSFYNEQGRVTRNVDPLLREHIYEYDALGRLRVETDALGNRILTRYDKHGNITRRDLIDLARDPSSGTVTGQRAFSTVFTFDELDRRVSRTDSLGNTTLYHYDSRNNLVLVVDALGNEHATEYDIHDRPVREVRKLTATGLGNSPVAATVETRFEYDANGNLEATIDAHGRRTEHCYDALDRRRSTRYPDKSEFLADYDEDGNLARTTDANGLRRRYTVDEVGRTTAVAVDTSGATGVVGGATFERFAYDGLDRRLLEENDFARYVVEFDSLSRPVRETMTFSSDLATLTEPFVLHRTFNEVGRLTELTYPNGRQLRLDRDPLGQLTGVHSVAKGADYPGRAETPDEHEIVRFEYAGRQRLRRINGNETVTEYAHDGAGRVVEIAHARFGIPLLTIQYLFDAVGTPRIRSDVTAAGTTAESFAYDSLYRLVHLDRPTRAPFDPAPLAPVTEPPPEPIPVRQAAIDALIGPMAIPAEPPTYAYDLVGNRDVTREGSAVGYRSNELDQYTRLSNLDGGGVVNLEYDATGNLVSDDRRSYTYDSLNRLVAVEESGSPVAQFVYDVRGRRILELVDGVAHQLIHDADNLIAEYWDGRLVAQYVHDDGVDRPLQIVAQTDAGADGSENWYHVDLVGSTRLLTDHAASITAAYTYAPFGGITSAPAARPYNRLLYTGRRLDERLGTYDYRSRQYDPVLGRFQQRDPAGPVNGTNLYTYAVNAPLGTVDPYGTEARSDRESPTPAEVEAYFDSQREHLDKVAQKYASLEHSRQAFDVYRDILDEIEASSLSGRPIDLNGLWEKARRYDWSWPNRSWMHIGRGGDTFAQYGPFGGDDVAGVDINAVFDAVIADRIPNPTLTQRIISNLAIVGIALPVLIGPGDAIGGGVGAGLGASSRASTVAFRTEAAAMRGALEATEGEALAALRAEALPGQRVWLVGPEGASTRGVRINGNRITYDGLAPAGSRQVKNDMVALSNMLGRRGDGFIRQGRWWSGTHGTPNGQFGGLQLEAKFFYHDKAKGHLYGWQVQNVAEHPRLTILSEGLEAPTVYHWCYSSSCFLP